MEKDDGRGLLPVTVMANGRFAHIGLLLLQTKLTNRVVAPGVVAVLHTPLLTLFAAL
jgi:hypothetical protein